MSFATKNRLLHTSRSVGARAHGRRGGQSHYQVLGVSASSSKREIKNKFYELSKKAHPDAGGSVDHFHELTEAYSVLGDDAKRRQYDSTLHPRSYPSSASAFSESGGPSTTYSPHSPYLRHQRSRTNTGPHRAWANSSSSPYGRASTQSRPQGPWTDYGFANRTGGATGGRRSQPPPQFGSASHHPNLSNYPFSPGSPYQPPPAAGSRRASQPEAPLPGSPHDELSKESGVLRFLGIAAFLLIGLTIGSFGGSTRAEEKTLEEKQEWIRQVKERDSEARLDA